jgi:hypothetical protein
MSYKQHLTTNDGYSDYGKADFKDHVLLGGGDMGPSGKGGNFTSNQTYSVDADGIHTATLQIQDEYYVVLDTISKMGEHPNHDYLGKTNFGAQRIGGNMGLGTVTFKGCPKNHEYINWSVNTSGYSKPIDQHPFFGEGKEIPKNKREFSGNASAYGYRFGGQIIEEPSGSRQAKLETSMGTTKFAYFPREALFNLPGVVSYLEPTLVLRFTLVTHANNGNETKLSNDSKKGGWVFEVGKIFTEDDLPAEIEINASQYMAEDKDKDNFNFLCTGARCHILGMAMRQEVELTLSGRLGHNSLIYKDSEVTGTQYSNNMVK